MGKKEETIDEQIIVGLVRQVALLKRVVRKASKERGACLACELQSGHAHDCPVAR